MSTLVFNWPQWVWLASMLIGVGITIARYGERKRDRYDWIDLLLTPAAGFTLLYYGGFFAGARP